MSRRLKKTKKRKTDTLNCPAASSTVFASRVESPNWNILQTASLQQLDRAPGLDHFLLLPEWRCETSLWTPQWGLWVGRWREKGEKRGVARCQVLPVTGHPIATETWVRGRAGEGRSGRARAPSSGAAGLWHELPARWAAALGMLEERSRTQWPSNAHTGSHSNNNKALCAPS